MKKNGFTLIELLIVIFISMIILFAAYSLLETGQKTSVSVGQRVFTNQDARSVLNLMAMEIRMASFSPESPMNVKWRTYNSSTYACGSVDGAGHVVANKGIQLAYADKISLQMDIKPVEDYNISPPKMMPGDNEIKDENEIIYYEYKDNAIRRAVGCGKAPERILGGTVANQDTDTIVINDASTPVFRYYKADDSEISFNSDGSNQNEIKDIRRIAITLHVQTKNVDPSTKQRKQMFYSTNVIARNHVLQ